MMLYSLKKIFPIDSKPFGKSYKEWTVEWWKWFCNTPKNINPSIDVNGKYVHENQYNQKILFLCQTVEGSSQVPMRYSTIERGTSVFMPIINWISIKGIDGNTKEDLQNIAKKKMDVIDKLELTINDIKINKNLECFRVRSDFFNVIFPEKNIFDIEAGIRLCISDGYWIFLQPIDEDIEISTSSSCSSGATKIEVRYFLSKR